MSAEMSALCQETWAKEKAELALKFKSEFESGQLNEWEFKDLMEDLIRTSEIIDKGNQMKFKAAAQKLITMALNAI
jgi:hypothetical protein